MAKKETTLTPTRTERDPFALIRAEFDRFFNEPGWAGFRLPAFRFGRPAEGAWTPQVDVFEKDNRLFTRIDLPGLKKEDVKVEVTDGHLAISGERKKEEEEKGEQFYRCEREYGSFYRVVPLPQGSITDQAKATFNNGVLEIRLPAPPEQVTRGRRLEITEETKK